MKSKSLLRVICLFVLFVSFFPASRAEAAAPGAVPPVDMFQLPWDQGIAWLAIDGIDNGTKRPATSSHSYKLGGAIDFAPRANMVTGENTSNFWVTAAAAGTVIQTSTCFVTIAHDGGWITQYQFLGNIQVKLGDTVARNQRLAIIADGVKYKYCPGYEEINVPHLHFMLRPSIIGATLAGWEVKYSPLSNRTTFSKGLTTVGLFQPLMNVMAAPATPTPTALPTNTPGNLPSPTPTLSGPYVSTSINPQSIDVGGTALVTVSLNNVPAEGYTSAEFACTYNANLFEISNINAGSLFGADPVVAINGPQAQSLIVAIAGSSGSKATTSGSVFTFNVKGLQVGQTVIECRARVSQGTNVLTEIPFAVDYLTIAGSTPTPNLTPSHTPTATALPTQTQPPVPSTATFTATPTIPTGQWLTFVNSRYGFQFLYPNISQIVAGSTDNYARINLPFVQGTNLSQKYLEVIVAENANPCRSPLATSSGLETSETVNFPNVSFLKETGQDGTAGHINKWVAYSTMRDNVCVSLDFVLRAANPGVFTTPPPLYDEAAESVVFGQIASSYEWLAVSATTTPTATHTPIPNGSPSPTATSTLTSSATPVSGNAGILAGKVIAGKSVTVNVYGANQALIVSTTTAPDGAFNVQVPTGSYTVVATASGFLSAQGTVTITAGNTSTMPTISLLAGDIDNNNVIDPFDALTIGMGYNTAVPVAADLNNDGTINVLDLELLARNYRKTGPIAWE